MHLLRRDPRLRSEACGVLTYWHDLWVNGQEVARFDLPQSFASLRGSSHRSPTRDRSEALSADNLLTPNARTGPVVTHEPGSDLRFLFVAGAGFEPATSGRDQGPIPDYSNSRVPLENLGFLRRFPIGRPQLYRNVSGRLPVVSDDQTMTARITGKPGRRTRPRGLVPILRRPPRRLPRLVLSDGRRRQGIDREAGSAGTAGERVREGCYSQSTQGLGRRSKRPVRRPPGSGAAARPSHLGWRRATTNPRRLSPSRSQPVRSIRIRIPSSVSSTCTRDSVAAARETTDVP